MSTPLYEKFSPPGEQLRVTMLGPVGEIHNFFSKHQQSRYDPLLQGEQWHLFFALVCHGHLQPFPLYMSTSSPGLIVFVVNTDTYDVPLFGSMNSRLEPLILALLVEPGPLWLAYLPFISRMFLLASFAVTASPAYMTILSPFITLSHE